MRAGRGESCGACRLPADADRYFWLLVEGRNGTPFVRKVCRECFVAAQNQKAPTVAMSKSAVAYMSQIQWTVFRGVRLGKLLEERDERKREVERGGDSR